MAKTTGVCFLCGEEGKGKRFTFYSGIRSGGSRTELISTTVIVMEWWKDLQLHEVHVCQDCQERLWENHVRWVPIQCWLAAVTLLGAALPSAIVGGGVGLALAGVLLAAALTAGGVGFWLRVQNRKPRRARLEPLIVQAAMRRFPDEGRTFLTNDVYIDLVDRGIIG
jgi:hypothetical protein